MLNIAFLLCILSIIPSISLSQNNLKLKCEVIEVSQPFKTDLKGLDSVHYLILHQAYSRDRKKLSNWLKTHSSSEVKFIINNKEYRGILCRLSHCFGRGILLYTVNIKIKKKDIITVDFSPQKL
jgi:hypothetical protein